MPTELHRRSAMAPASQRGMTDVAASFKFIPSALAISIGLTAGAPSRAAAQAADDFYKGKQIRLIVSTDAGGAYDVYARLIAPFLREHIPGRPTIVIQH